jgi:hypothetical protein
VSPKNLIDVANALVGAQKGRPKQAFLCRAVSSVYYALFHTIAGCCADCLIGGKNSERSTPAWKQVYRSLEHGHARGQCVNAEKIRLFPRAIQDFANLFATMQKKRHQADYDPLERLDRSSVLLDIAQAKLAIADFNAVPLKDKRAFAVLMLLKSR